MKNVILGFTALILFVGCAQTDFQTGQVGPQGPPGQVVYVPTVPTDVASILADENTYRLGLGQTQLSSGLSCVLYSTTGGDRIQASVAGHNTLIGLMQVGSFLLTQPFNQQTTSVNDGLNILPTALRNMYKNNYMLRCSGQIVVTETNYYQFDLASDDGAVLYVDGSKLIDNDNAHGTATVTGTKYLRRGVHAFRLDYSQSGAGAEALVLMTGGQLVDSSYFAH